MIFLSKDKKMYKRNNIILEHKSLPIIMDDNGCFIEYNKDTDFEKIECFTKKDLMSLLNVESINKYYDLAEKFGANLYYDEDDKFYMTLGRNSPIIDCQAKEIFSKNENYFISLHEDIAYLVSKNGTKELKKAKFSYHNKLSVIDIEDFDIFHIYKTKFLIKSFSSYENNISCKDYRILQLKDCIVFIPKHSIVFSKIQFCNISYIVICDGKFYFIDNNRVIEFYLRDFLNMSIMSHDLSEDKIPTSIYANKFLFGGKILFEIDFSNLTITTISTNVLHEFINEELVLFDKNGFITKFKI